MTDQSSDVLATKESDEELSCSPSCSSSNESNSSNSGEGRDVQPKDGSRMSTPKPSGRIKLTIRKTEINRVRKLRMSAVPNPCCCCTPKLKFYLYENLPIRKTLRKCFFSNLV